jgi:hypothetical protein
MGLLRFVLWTAFAMGLGVALATYPVGGEPLLYRFEAAWKHSEAPAKVDALKTEMVEKIEDAKDAMGTARDKTPRERHSEKDREALNKLIAKRGSTK